VINNTSSLEHFLSQLDPQEIRESIARQNATLYGLKFIANQQRQDFIGEQVPASVSICHDVPMTIDPPQPSAILRPYALPESRPATPDVDASANANIQRRVNWVLRDPSDNDGLSGMFKPVVTYVDISKPAIPTNPITPPPTEELDIGEMVSQSLNLLNEVEINDPYPLTPPPTESQDFEITSINQPPTTTQLLLMLLTLH
jgi:hypothetical protein